MAKDSDIEMKIINLDKVTRLLQKIGEKVRDHIGTALYREAERIMTASKKQVPVDTGALRSTGHIREPEVSGNMVSVVLGYGGPAGAGLKPRKGKRSKRVIDNVGYAVYVHEKLNAKHHVGGAKFLEKPMLEAQKGMDDRLAREIAAIIRETA